MHILLTDVLRCPRCGPEFGLVLLADRVEERRIQEGRLGCANCRETYPIRGGEADLRVPGGEALPAGTEGAGDGEEAVRVAALLGLAEPWGSVLLLDGGAELAEAVAALVPGVEVVAASAAPAGREARGVTRVAAGLPLPFAPRSLRGVALGGEGAGSALDEAARVVAQGGRVLVREAPEGTAGRLAAAGLSVLLDQEGVVVAGRPGGAPSPLRTPSAAG